MSDKSQKYNKTQRRPEKKGSQLTQRVKSAVKPEYPSWLNYAILTGVLLVTAWCYHYTVHNQFTNWDDGIYISEDSYIKNMSSQNMKMILFSDITHNYYHPITMLSLAINWHFTQANPESYYITEIIIHLLNTILVFLLAYSLFGNMVKRGYGKIKGIPYLAGLCALWQGVHPMHVESVSWIAERKDVLYLFFYLIGLMIYMRYIMKDKLILLIPVALMYFFSLCSKPLAVVFPLSLFTFDVLLKRKIEWRLLFEKIPFFIISLLFGYLAYKMQSEGGSITSFHTFSIMQRIMFVGYNYMIYLIKLFAPFNLCSFYPYPQLTDSGYLPLYFYFAPFIAVIFTLGLLYLAFRMGENYFRVALFGFGFYFFNVMFILQFISSGPSITADRYTYVSYFGFTFMMVYFIYILIDKLPAFKVPVILVVTTFSCMLAYLCQARTEVWHNTKTLWEDVISKYPAGADTVYNPDHKEYVVHIKTGVETAYKNLGNYYVQDKNPPDYDSAYMYYTVLEHINSKDAGIYSNLGNIWAIRNNIKKSLDEYTKSLKLDSVNFDTYLDRAITYSRMGQNDLAMKDYDHAFKMDSTNQRLIENRAYTLLNGTKNYPAAVADYNRLIAIDPRNMDYYRNRGLAKLNGGKPNDALDDFNRVINANPKDKECLYYFSFAYKVLKSYPKAIDYAQQGQQAGFKLPDGYMAELDQLSKSKGK